MTSRLVWFVLGALSGAGVMLLLQKVREQEEVESFEDLAEELSRRFDTLEASSK